METNHDDLRLTPRIPPRPRHRRRRPAVRPQPAQPRLCRPGAAAQAAAGRHVQPQRRRPDDFWPDEEGDDFTLKESLKPLEPFQDRTLILHGVCDKVRGDGDNHMRGIGCLLTGIELFPGNIQGGSRHARPAGPAASRSIRRSRTSCRPTRDPHALRLARVRRDGPRPGRHLDPHGLRRPEQADRADRRPVPDVRQALRPA